MTHMFEGKLVRLRASDPADDQPFGEWARNYPDEERFLDEIHFPRPRTRAPADESAPKPPAGENENFQFTIETLSGETAGAIHIHHANRHNGTFMYGIALLPDHRRKGYAAEAIRLVLNYYFNERRYQKCNVEVFGFNPGSARLHETVGFTLEGRLRRMIYSMGAYHDVLCYGITDEEFRQRNQDQR
ncbi:MAG: GNAT family protein [Anaerolineae bacterium]